MLKSELVTQRMLPAARILRDVTGTCEGSIQEHNVFQDFLGPILVWTTYASDELLRRRMRATADETTGPHWVP